MRLLACLPWQTLDAAAPHSNCEGSHPPRGCGFPWSQLQNVQSRLPETFTGWGDQDGIQLRFMLLLLVLAAGFGLRHAYMLRLIPCCVP